MLNNDESGTLHIISFFRTELPKVLVHISQNWSSQSEAASVQSMKGKKVKIRLRFA